MNLRGPARWAVYGAVAGAVTADGITSVHEWPAMAMIIFIAAASTVLLMTDETGEQ